MRNGGRRTRPGLAFALTLLLALLAGCRTAPPPPLERYAFEDVQMGMAFRIVLYAGDAVTAQAAARAAMARVAELNATLSDYEEESELSRLSRSAGTGRAVRLSDDLWRVLARAQYFSRRSDGAFDVTVGPYVQLWRRARRQRALPEPWRLTAAREAVGYHYVELDPARHTARLLRPHMRLDLGGIAKGYAIEEAYRVLKARGVPRALVTGGGDMFAGEPPPGKPGWRIEVAPLDVPDPPPPTFIALRNRALATSGDLYQRLEIDGKRYSHIVDPRTGIGLTDHSLVCVSARDGMTADALSKVVSVLGPDEGLRRLARERGVEAHLVRQPAARIETRETPGFRRLAWPSAAP